MTVIDCEKNYLKTRDQKHLDELYKHMMPYATSASSYKCQEYNYTGSSWEIAHNAVANIIMRFVQNPNFCFRNSYKGYVCRAIHNALIDEFRKKKHISIDLISDQEISVDDKILKTVIKNDIKKSVRKIVKRYAVGRGERKRFEEDIFHCLTKGKHPLYRIYKYKGPENIEIRHRYNFVAKLVDKDLSRYV